MYRLAPGKSILLTAILLALATGIPACGYDSPKFNLLTGARESDTLKTNQSDTPIQPASSLMQSSIVLNADTKEDLLKLSGDMGFESDDEYDDLWDRMRDNFRIEYQTNRRVESQLRNYAISQSFMDQIGERGGRYLYHILEEAEKRDIPAEIALLPAIESSFQPFIKSPHGAAGIWQIVPGTGQHLGLKQSGNFDGIRGIKTSTAAALDYLDALHDAFDGDWLLALAAYNSGEGTISRAVEKNRRRGKPTDFWSLDLSKETREFVPRFLALTRLVQNPDAFNVSLPPIPNEPYFASVEVDKPMNLNQVAKLVDVDIAEMKMLNPGVKQANRAQKGSFEFNIPADKEHLLQYRLIALSPEQEESWGLHRVVKGESLKSIANQYDTKVAVLKEANQIENNKLTPGEVIKVPPVEAVTSVEAAAPATPKVVAANQSSYKVQPGDTLWAVSRKFNVSVAKLAQWNGISVNGKLKANQSLLVQANSAQPTNSAKKSVQYAVKPGDSLSSISKKFRVDILDLKKWNKDLSQQEHLQPGQILEVRVNNNDKKS